MRCTTVADSKEKYMAFLLNYYDKAIDCRRSAEVRLDWFLNDLPTRKRRDWCGLIPPAKFTTKKASFTAKLNGANSCLKTMPKKRDIVKRRQKLQQRPNPRQQTLNKNNPEIGRHCSHFYGRWLLIFGYVRTVLD